MENKKQIFTYELTRLFIYISYLYAKKNLDSGIN